jgi:ABC-type multidrug transport system fused ATPase/permease subunit
VERIVVLGPGGVVEVGSGPELIARGGVYAGLYRSAHLNAPAAIPSMSAE